MAGRKPSNLTGIEKFRSALVDAGLPDMIRWLRSKKNAELLMDEVHKQIFELGPPTPPFKPTPRTRYEQLLMLHALEIQTTLDTIKDIEFYLGEFPYRKTRIAKHRHLQFHVGAFYQELYIFRGRLLKFLKFVERQHRKDTRLSKIKAACDTLEKFVIEFMRKEIAVRGSHVHDWRWTDPKIERLNAINFYTLMPKVGSVFRSFYDTEYRKTRDERRESMNETLAAAQQLVDAYFDVVFKLLFDDKDKLIYPGHLRF